MELRARRLIVVGALTCLPAFAAFASPQKSGQGQLAPLAKQLDEAVRGGDLLETRRLAATIPGEAEQLFTNYLRTEREAKSAAAKQKSLDAAERLAQVFFQIYEYDFEPSLVAFWRTASPETKDELLRILADHASLHGRERKVFADPYTIVFSSVTDERRLLAADFKALAERYGSLGFPKGVLQATLASARAAMPDLVLLKKQMDESSDELAQAWSKKIYTKEGEKSIEIARRRGLAKLELSQTIENILAHSALREFDRLRGMVEQALRLARSIPAPETSVMRFQARMMLPTEIEYLSLLWRIESLAGRRDVAQQLQEQILSLSRQLGGKRLELAVVCHLVRERLRGETRRPDLEQLAERLAREFDDLEWRAATLHLIASRHRSRREYSQAVHLSNELMQLYTNLGMKARAMEALRIRMASLVEQPDKFEVARQDCETIVKYEEGAWKWSDATDSLIWFGTKLVEQNRLQMAREYLTRAVATAEKSKDLNQVAWAYSERAKTYPGADASALRDLEEARRLARLAREKTGQQGLELGFATRLAEGYRQAGRYSDATRLLKEIVEGWEKWGTKEAASSALATLMEIYSHELGEPTTGLEYGLRGLAMNDKIKSFVAMAEFHSRVGATYAALGQARQALEHWSRALEIAQKYPNLGGMQQQRAFAFRTRGQFHRDVGFHEAALRDFEEQRNSNPKSYAGPVKAEWLGEVGVVHLLRGDAEQALRLARDAASEEAALPNEVTPVASTTSGDAGEIFLSTGNYQEAISYYSARARRFHQHGLWDAKRRALEGQGQAQWKSGDPKGARESWLGAIALAEKHLAGHMSSNALKLLGELELASGNVGQARGYLERSVASANPHDLQLKWQIERALAQVYAQDRAFNLAADHYARALEALGSARERLRPEEFRLRFGIEKTKLYDEYAALLAGRAVETGEARFAEKALWVAEGRRAQALWDLMSAGWSSASLEAIPEAARQRLEIEARLAAKQNALREQFNRPIEARNAVLMDTLETELRSIQAEHEKLLTMLAQGQYRYTSAASLPEDLSDKLRNTLPKESALLEYLVTEERTYAFLLTASGFRAVALAPTRAKLRERVAGLLLPFQQVRSGAADLTRMKFDWRAAHALYREIFGPLEAHLRGHEELFIVPDDALFYVPLEMLVERMPAAVRGGRVLFAEFERARFLLHRYSMNYLTAAVQLLPSAPGHRGTDGSRTLLALANPAAPGQGVQAETSEPLTRQLRSVRFRSAFGAVPGSADEVSRIRRYFRDDAVTVATGASASESAYKSLASNFDVIHLATHAVASDDHPLHSTLLLAPGEESQEDGFLQAFEILRQPLRARLVVLSACETALGRRQNGEGLVGLVAAFQQAGAQSVVATLWSIDESAAELMGRFYEEMSRSVTLSEALKNAKQGVIKKRTRLGSIEVSFSHPFFWAPFVLIGFPSAEQISAPR